MTTRNIWNQGILAAENPGLKQRFLHSSSITSLRRSKKLSTLGKVGTAAVSLAGKFIPVPAVGEILSKAASITSERIRSYAISKKKAGYTTHPNTEKLVKFGWKDLDISECDRYRYKIKESIDTFNSDIAKLQAEFTKATDAGHACSAIFKVAYDIGYVHRRINKMETKLAAIEDVVRVTRAWLAQVKTNVDNYQQSTKPDYMNMLVGTPVAAHAKCDKQICVLKDTEWSGVTNKEALDRLCTVTSIAREFIEPEMVISMAVDSAQFGATDGKGWIDANKVVFGGS